MHKRTNPQNSTCSFVVVLRRCAAVGALAFVLARTRTHGCHQPSGISRPACDEPTFSRQLTASGRVESSKRTVIECELENIAVGVRGQRLAAGGASVLLSVIPEGTTVKRGDVLAVLDSSDYEELLRIQKMTVERAAADHLQAELDLEIAKLAVREFEEGTLQETIEDFEGKILLARSDLERATDRVAWARRMKDKGYIPAAMVTSEEYKQESVDRCR